MGNSNIFDIYCAIKQISQNKIWTNIYSLNPLETLKKLESRNSIIFFKKNALVLAEDIGPLKKVHFLMEACDNSMDIFNDIKFTPLILELIEDGRNNKFIELLSTYGFYSYGTLKRMTLKMRENIKTESAIKIEYANLDDAIFLSTLYRKYFDFSIDRIPNTLEIDKQISDGLFICSKEMGNITAFASITLSLGTSTLNHIFVRPEFRGRGIGESLLKSFLALASESKGVKLWVLPNNFPAIAMYKKYNFEFDGLENMVYKK